jgi:hypothetical protein
MSDIEKSIRDVLVADSAVTALVTTYDFTTGAAKGPAIFTDDSLPRNSEGQLTILPCVTITMVGGPGWGTRWAVWNAINRAELTITGFGEVGVYADAPQKIVDPEEFPGFRVPLMVRILEV